MRRSIAKEMAGVFIGLMALVLVANLVINNVFMERYYVMKLQKTLTQAYTQIDSHITDTQIDMAYLSSDFWELCSTNNISMVVVNQGYQPILSFSDRGGSDASTDSGTAVMQGRLFGYTMGIDDDAQVLLTTDHYTIQKKTDQRMEMDYLESWGTLSCGYYFMMRIPMDSIRMNVGISSEFIMYVSVIIVLVSFVLIWWLSKKIAKPIRELTDLSGRMANLDFDAKYTSGGANEIGQLGEHFNRMSETLEKTISQLKSANNQLQRDIEKKSQIDEMRKEFLSNVSHELKTPLALIQGYAEGLKECINDDEESREFYCEVIMDEAGKMNELVKELLTLNQLEFGNEKVEMERFDLVQLIQGKMQSIQILAQQHDAHITYSGSSSLHVWGDEFKVEEVLTNYLSNALNHLEGEHRIEIRTQVRGKTVRTSVFNTGQPIPEEDLDRIWIKFYKVDKARTREYGGSGVGLSIVKAIMDSFHQKYGVQNFDDGVEFWFELEYADGEQMGTEQEAVRQSEAERQQAGQSQAKQAGTSPGQGTVPEPGARQAALEDHSSGQKLIEQKRSGSQEP